MCTPSTPPRDAPNSSLRGDVPLALARRLAVCVTLAWVSESRGGAAVSASELRRARLRWFSTTAGGVCCNPATRSVRAASPRRSRSALGDIITYSDGEPAGTFSQIRLNDGTRVLISITRQEAAVFKLRMGGTVPAGTLYKCDRGALIERLSGNPNFQRPSSPLQDLVEIVLQCSSVEQVPLALEAALPGRMPANAESSAGRFCTACGEPRVATANFCGRCGQSATAPGHDSRTALRPTSEARGELRDTSVAGNPKGEGSGTGATRPWNTEFKNDPGRAWLSVLVAGAFAFWGLSAAYKAASEAAPVVTGSSASATRGQSIVEEAPALTKIDSTVGAGLEVRSGMRVSVHYTGWLYYPSAESKVGKKFDSSKDRREPFEFQLGNGDVIRGFDEGVAGMKVGGTRVLVIPSSFAYGDRGAGADIPPNTWLMFEIELLGAAY